MHSATGVAPFTAILRFRPSAPVDRLLGDSSAAPATDTVADFVAESSATTPTLYTTIAERSRRAADAMRRRYDARVTNVRFSAGDDVWVFAEDRDGTNKLSS